jgi:peptidoglycan/LPS O-acetylase OafA/YrhL
MCEVSTSAMAGLQEKSVYRPEIDGLRAVAVFLVILYHLRPALIPGGFIGVDIFFVISGFVVTGSVLHFAPMSRWAAAGLFWRRRVLRIAPALMAMVMGGVLVLALLVPPLPQESYTAYFRTGVAALAGVSNLYFSRSQVDYFIADQSLNPYLHTWSLSVEEQFYLIFVVVFIALLGPPRVERAWVHLLVIGALGIGSYLAFATVSDPIGRYYVITYRYWEIAAGSILAFLTRLFSLAPPGGWRRIMAHLALAGTLAGCALAPSATGFPSTRISLAVLATALLIAAMRAEDGWAGSALARGWMVGLGKASYSIYLWHIPVFLAYRLTLGLNHALGSGLALVTTLGLAFLSYRFVEEPFRRSRQSFWRRLVPALVTGLVLCLGLSVLGERYPGAFYAGGRQEWAQDWHRPRQLPYAASNRILVSACAIGPGGVVPTNVPEACSTVSDPAMPLLFLIGDSHAYSAWGMGLRAADLNGYRFSTLTHPGCAIHDARADGDESSCAIFWRQMPALIEKTARPGTVIVVSTFWRDEGEVRLKLAMDRLRRLTLAAEKQGALVVVQAPLPVFETPPYLCIEEVYRRDFHGCNVKRSAVESGRREPMRRLKDWQAAHANARIWDPLPSLCLGEVCSALRQGKPLFRDRDHLAYYGATYLGDRFSQEFLRMLD